MTLHIHSIGTRREYDITYTQYRCWTWTWLFIFRISGRILLIKVNLFAHFLSIVRANGRTSSYNVCVSYVVQLIELLLPVNLVQRFHIVMYTVHFIIKLLLEVFRQWLRSEMLSVLFKVFIIASRFVFTPLWPVIYECLLVSLSPISSYL
jgi:hypothetical protein